MNIQNRKVIGIGELLWDLLPEGKQLGGAPCNFVYHAQKLGLEGRILSAVGNDQNGKEIIDLLEAKRISSQLIQVNDKPTGTVDVSLSFDGIPEYTIHEDVAWDYILYTREIEESIREADVICFGSLAQRKRKSRETIVKALQNCPEDALVVFDVNLRQHYYNKDLIDKSLRLSDIVKLNEEELLAVTVLLGLNAVINKEDQLRALMKQYDLKLVAVTKGDKGSILTTPYESSYKATPKVSVKDTVGAGDSFTAALIYGFLAGEPLKSMHERAIELSAFVCTREGAMPEYDEIT